MAESTSKENTHLSLNNICQNFDDLLKDWLSEHGFPYTNDCLCRKTNKLKDGDICVPKGCLSPKALFGRTLLEDLKKKLLTSHKKALVTSVTNNAYNAFLFQLDRTSLFFNVIKMVLEKRQSFGQNMIHTGTKMIMNAVELNRHLLSQGDNKLTVDTLRSVIVLSHLQNILVANGFHIDYINYCSVNKALTDLLELLSFEMTLNPKPEKDMTQSLSSAAENSPYLKCDDASTVGDTSLKNKAFIEKNKKVHTPNQCGDNTPAIQTQTLPTAETSERETLGVGEHEAKKSCLLLDAKRFLQEHKIPQGKGKFDKNIDVIEVTVEGQPSSHIKQVAVLENWMIEEENDRIVLHIVPQRYSFFQQKVDILWRMMSACAVKHSQCHLVIGPVTQMNACDVESEASANDIFQSRYRQLEEASVMKYGDEVYHGSGWEDTIMSLTVASIKFEFLHLNCRNVMKIDSSEGDTRMGSFVMYNYARLSTLFTHFEEAVEEGTYPPLPTLDEVDFSTLKGEEEWSLLYEYILTFPDVVSGCVGEIVFSSGEIHPDIHTHKICNFLIGLSRNLSSYYSRTHILAESLPHLLPVMFARLFLMKATHQVMENALLLMGIRPLKQL